MNINTDSSIKEILGLGHGLSSGATAEQVQLPEYC
jgi:hypothetical protein